MNRMVAKLGLCMLVVLPLWSQTASQQSKRLQVLGTYERFMEADRKVQQLQSRTQELKKEFDPFLESESALNRFAGAALLVGALRAWIPELKDYLAEEDALITKMVTSSAGLTGDAGRYADEGVRLLRERHVYQKQALEIAESLAKDSLKLLRGIREDRLSDLSDLLDEQDFGANLKTMDDLDRKADLTLAQAKDAFARVKAASK